MAIVVEKSEQDLIDGYTCVPNWIYDKFKYDEIAVISYLLSKPANWVFNKKEMCNTLGMGRDKMNTIFKMLFEEGMITLDSDKRNEDGRFQNITYYFSLSGGKPNTDNRIRESVFGNPTSNNNDYNNTDFNNKELLKKYIKKDSSSKKENSLKKKTEIDYTKELTVLRALNKVSSINTREDNRNVLNTIKKVLEWGATADEIIGMINMKAKEWGGTEYVKYLRHQTLFRKSKFEMYMEEYKNQSIPDPKVHTLTPLSKFYQKKTKEQNERDAEIMANLPVYTEEEKAEQLKRVEIAYQKMERLVALKMQQRGY